MGALRPPALGVDKAHGDALGQRARAVEEVRHAVGLGIHAQTAHRHVHLVARFEPRVRPQRRGRAVHRQRYPAIGAGELRLDLQGRSRPFAFARIAPRSSRRAAHAGGHLPRLAPRAGQGIAGITVEIQVACALDQPDAYVQCLALLRRLRQGKFVFAQAEKRAVLALQRPFARRRRSMPSSVSVWSLGCTAYWTMPKGSPSSCA